MTEAYLEMALATVARTTDRIAVLPSASGTPYASTILLV